MKMFSMYNFYIYLYIDLFSKKLYINGNIYIDRSFFSIRTDSRDRFGTKIEKRISKNNIKKLCTQNNLDEIYFSEKYNHTKEIIEFIEENSFSHEKK